MTTAHWCFMCMRIRLGFYPSTFRAFLFFSLLKGQKEREWTATAATTPHAAGIQTSRILHNNRVRMLHVLPGRLHVQDPYHSSSTDYLHEWWVDSSPQLNLLMHCKLCEVVMKSRSHGFQCMEQKHCLHGAPKIGHALLSDLLRTVT